MPEYRAQPGQEDRHGEMTGAISINLVLVCLPVTIVSIVGATWLGPWRTLALVLPLAVGLTFICRPVSRWIWSHISALMDGDLFGDGPPETPDQRSPRR